MQPRFSNLIPLTVFAAVASAAPDVLSPTQLASHTRAGFAANNASRNPSISRDGRFVAFESAATDLVPGDTNGFPDVFVRDNQTGTVERISIGTAGEPANSVSIGPSISGDGRYVCFDSAATNMTTPPSSGLFLIFVRDRQTGTTEIASVSSSGELANNTTELSRISPDGRYVAFTSYADNLNPGDTPTGRPGMFLRDRVAGTTTRIDIGPGGVHADNNFMRPSVASGGRFVAFGSYASNLVPGGTTGGTIQIFLYDGLTQTISLVSKDANGVQADNHAEHAWLSADGRYLAFDTIATNLLPAPNANGGEVCLFDRTTGTLERVGLAMDGSTLSSGSSRPSVSDDGRFVSFESFGGSVAPDTFGSVYVRDRQLGHTFAVCANDDGTSPLSAGSEVALSGDGSMIAMTLTVPLVANDANSTQDVYARGIGAPVIYCQSKQNSQSCLPTIGFSGAARMSNNLALTVTCSNVLNNKWGGLTFGLAGAAQIPFAAGVRCVASPIGRTLPFRSGGTPGPALDCSGTWTANLGQVLAASPLGAAVGAGDVIELQWWGRDPGQAEPNNLQLSNALQVVVAP